MMMEKHFKPLDKIVIVGEKHAFITWTLLGLIAHKYDNQTLLHSAGGGEDRLELAKLKQSKSKVLRPSIPSWFMGACTKPIHM